MGTVAPITMLVRGPGFDVTLKLAENISETTCPSQNYGAYAVPRQSKISGAATATFPVTKNLIDLQVLRHSILTSTLRHFNDNGVLAIGYMQSDQRSLFRVEAAEIKRRCA